MNDLKDLSKFKTTAPVILMHPHLHEAVAIKIDATHTTADKFFSASFLFAGDHSDLQAIRKICLLLVRAELPGNYADAVTQHKAAPRGADPYESLLAILASKLDFPLRSGDTAADARKAKGKTDGEFQRGQWIVKASSGDQYPPALGGIENGRAVDYATAEQLALSKPKFFFGAECYCALNFRFYKVGNNKPGVKAYLSQVFVNGKGEKMAAGSSASESFGSYVGHVSAVNPLDDEISY